MPNLNLYLKNFTLIILAVQIFNLSIYNTDFYTFSSISDTAQMKDINPVDSLAELIVESVPGYQDTFPEPEHKNDKPSAVLKHNITFKMAYIESFAQVPEKAIDHFESFDNNLISVQDSYSFLFWKEINHPPA